MSETQMGMSVALTSQALNFQANMASAVINGSIGKGQEQEQQTARAAGMAAEGVGARLNVEA